MQIIFNYTFPVSLNSVKDWMADNCLQLSSDRSSNFCPGWHCPKRKKESFGSLLNLPSAI